MQCHPSSCSAARQLSLVELQPAYNLPRTVSKLRDCLSKVGPQAGSRNSLAISQ